MSAAPSIRQLLESRKARQPSARPSTQPPAVDPLDQWLTVNEAARLLKIHRITLQRRIRAGIIHVYRVKQSDVLRLHLSDVLDRVTGSDAECKAKSCPPVHRRSAAIPAPPTHR